MKKTYIKPYSWVSDIHFLRDLLIMTGSKTTDEVYAPPKEEHFTWGEMKKPDLRTPNSLWDEDEFTAIWEE